jgi:hypothetical protein
MPQRDRPRPKHFLELHRSVRFIAPNPARILPGFFLAAAISGWIAYQGAAFLNIHEALRERILEWTGVPISGHATIASFGMQNLRIAVSPVASYHENPWLLSTVCTITAAIFLVLGARVKLSRSLMIFALAALVLSAVDLWLQPLVISDSTFFTAFWLRCEFVIWILTPWLMAMLVSVIMPSRLAGAFWITAAPAYAILWSAIRLAFCTGLLYYAGPVLILLLWSLLGILADLLALCLFYSLAVFQAGSLNRRAMLHV